MIQLSTGSRRYSSVFAVRRPASALLILVLTATVMVGTPGAGAAAPPTGAGDPDPSAVVFLYDLNRVRANPGLLVSEYGLDVDPAEYTVRPPLAPSSELLASAELKSEEMNDFSYFAHQSAVTGIWPNRLARLSGFDLPGYYPDDANNIESIMWGSSNEFIALHALLESPPHRYHLLGQGTFFGGHHEVGVGTDGPYWTIHTGERAEWVPAVTVYVYEDRDGSGDLGVGEAVAGVAVSIGDDERMTGSAGMVAASSGAGIHRITLLLPGGELAAFDAQVGGDNTEIEAVVGELGSVSWVGAGSVVDLTPTCLGEPATHVGTAGADEIVGTEERDVIVALGGDDVITSLGGDDLVCAGDGDDLVFGGAGSDVVLGESGRDVLDGGPGDDDLQGGAGKDTLFGKSGRDRLRGQDGDDRLLGGGHRDRFIGGSGEDRVDFRSKRGVTVDVPSARAYGEGLDILISIEVFTGTAAADTMIGGEGPDTFKGKDGDDLLVGNGGDDRLFGQDGDDLLDGGPGDDVLRGGSGDNTIVDG